MSYANGIITAPVSISDIQHVLGVSDTDLATLCKSGNINMLSISKPTRKPVLFTADFQDGNSGDEYTNGISCYGVKKPCMALTTAQWGAPDRIDFSSLINNKWFHDHPNGGMSEPFRLADFNNYNHNIIGYTFTGTKTTVVKSMPFYTTQAFSYYTSNIPLTVTATINFLCDDVLTDSSNPKCGNLGMFHLCNASPVDDNKTRFGVIIYAPVSSYRTSSFAYKYEDSDNYIGIVDSSSDAGDYLQRISIKTPSLNSLFYEGETVYIIPFLFKVLSSTYYVFSLNAPWNNISSVIVPTKAVEPTYTTIIFVNTANHDVETASDISGLGDTYFELTANYNGYTAGWIGIKDSLGNPGTGITGHYTSGGAAHKVAGTQYQYYRMIIYYNNGYSVSSTRDQWDTSM